MLHFAGQTKGGAVMIVWLFLILSNLLQCIDLSVFHPPRQTTLQLSLPFSTPPKLNLPINLLHIPFYKSHYHLISHVRFSTIVQLSCRSPKNIEEPLRTACRCTTLPVHTFCCRVPKPKIAKQRNKATQWWFQIRGSLASS